MIDVYRLLYGVAPESYQAPDWREAAKRVVDRDKAVQEAMRPLTSGVDTWWYTP